MRRRSRFRLAGAAAVALSFAVAAVATAGETAPPPAAPPASAEPVTPSAPEAEAGPAAGATAPPAAEPRIPGVRLLVLIVVDQLPRETLERARPALHGGLERLLDESVELRQAWHRHGWTQTSPGHATLITGLAPRRHGVIANDWFDRSRDEVVWAGQDPDTDEPSNLLLLASGLGDWVRARDPRGHSYAAGGKYYPAVVASGQRAEAVVWFEPGERAFVAGKAWPVRPAWLAEPALSAPIRARFGTPWEPLPLPEGIDPAALGFVQLEGSGLPRPFPHAMGDALPYPAVGFFRALADTPLVDEHLAAIARELVAREGLGADEHLDFLFLGFSALDRVAHEYGQHSLETLDSLLRLDRALGELLDFLDERVGREHLAIALSSDHGAAPMPELGAGAPPGMNRKTPESIACVQRTAAQLDARYGERPWFRSGFYLDEAEVARSGVPRSDVERTVREWVQACPGVERVWTRSELEPEVLPAALAGDPWAPVYHAAFHPERSPDFLVQFEPFYLDRLRGTTHRTPYAYDARVPLLLRLPGIAPRRVDEPVATTDLAPTLAALLGLRPEVAPDGRDLSGLLLP